MRIILCKGPWCSLVSIRALGAPFGKSGSGKGTKTALDRGSNPRGPIMGIKVEFNPDLALRNISEFSADRRSRRAFPEDMKP